MGTIIKGESIYTKEQVIMSNLRLEYDDYIQLYVENYDSTADAVFEKNIQVQINE